VNKKLLLVATSILCFVALSGCSQDMANSNLQETPEVSGDTDSDVVEAPIRPRILQIDEIGKIPAINSQILEVRANWVDPGDNVNTIVTLRTCINDDVPDGETFFSLSSQPWTLIDSDGGRYDMGGFYERPETQPIYPQGYDNDPVFYPGDCVKGKLVFRTGSDITPSELRYRNDAGEEMRWILSD
jgi:hypothetical protein